MLPESGPPVNFQIRSIHAEPVLEPVESPFPGAVNRILPARGLCREEKPGPAKRRNRVRFLLSRAGFPRLRVLYRLKMRPG